jgi:hypothetical protein
MSSTPLSLNKFLIEREREKQKENVRKGIKANPSSGNDHESSKRDHWINNLTHTESVHQLN